MANRRGGTIFFRHFFLAFAEQWKNDPKYFAVRSKTLFCLKLHCISFQKQMRCLPLEKSYFNVGRECCTFSGTNSLFDETNTQRCYRVCFRVPLNTRTESMCKAHIFVWGKTLQRAWGEPKHRFNKEERDCWNKPSLEMWRRHRTLYRQLELLKIVSSVLIDVHYTQFFL